MVWLLFSVEHVFGICHRNHERHGIDGIGREAAAFVKLLCVFRNRVDQDGADTSDLGRLNGAHHNQPHACRRR